MCDWNSWSWTDGGGFIMMGFGMILVWLIPLGLIIALVMNLNKQSKSTRQPETAIEILEKTYARGEISRDEFLQKRDDLLGTKKTLPQEQRDNSGN